MPNITDATVRLVSLGLALLMAACAGPGPRPIGMTSQARTVAPWPEDARTYEVDTTASRLRILVAPDGPLAGLGHHHVIGGPVISGRVALAEPFERSALELQVNVAGLEVDRPAWRDVEDSDFDTQPDADAVAGTRENMLSARVLDAANHPRINLVATGMSGPRWQPDIGLNVTLRGVTRHITVPVALDIDDKRLVAAGQFTLKPSAFGLEPFSTAGGGLRVADDLRIRFSIVARVARNPGDRP